MHIYIYITFSPITDGTIKRSIIVLIAIKPTELKSVGNGVRKTVSGVCH